LKPQNYANHRRFVPGFHGVLFLLLIAALGGAINNLRLSWGDHQRIYSASLIVIVCVCLVLLYWYTRTFPLKAQDRAIRAEENLRHYTLTGKLLDPRLTVGQIVALRFAPDNEFVELVKRAADETLPAEEIKKQIKNWRPDYHRV
jgi:hypothetical protein